MEKGEKMFMYEKGKKSYGIVMLLYLFIGPLAGFYVSLGTGLVTLFIVGLWDVIICVTFLKGIFTGDISALVGGIIFLLVANWIGIVPIFYSLKEYNEKLRKMLYGEYIEEKEEPNSEQEEKEVVLERKIGIPEIIFLGIIVFLIILAFVLV